MSKRTKWIVGGVAAVVLAGAGMALSGRGKGDGAVEVQTEPVERRTIVQSVEATGRVQPVTQVNISADVSAKITRLDVAEGEWVDKGRLLLELDRERYLAEVESAEANLRVSQAQARVAEENLAQSRRELERVESLFAQQLESGASLDAARAAAEVERARHRSSLDQVEQSRAALKQARDALSKTTIYAPISGTVSMLNKEMGEIALGSQFQEDVILVLSNLSGMEALVDVDENDIVRVEVGDRAVIEVDALPGTTFEGSVTEIANSAKVGGAGTAEQKTEFEVKIAILDPGTSLRPGMTASAVITTETREEALGVPIQSVAVRTPDQIVGGGANEKDEGGTPAGERFPVDKDGFAQVVFVVEDGVAHARPVTTGIQSDTHIELLEGVQPGEQVVVGSYRAISRDLKDGTAVTAEKPSAAGGRG